MNLSDTGLGTQQAMAGRVASVWDSSSYSLERGIVASAAVSARPGEQELDPNFSCITHMLKDGCREAGTPER